MSVDKVGGLVQLVQSIGIFWRHILVLSIHLCCVCFVWCWRTVSESLDSIQVGWNVLQCIVVCCSMLQCFAVCYSVLCCSMLPSPNSKIADDAKIVCFRLCSVTLVACTLQHIATHCSTLQHTAALLWTFRRVVALHFGHFQLIFPGNQK